MKLPRYDKVRTKDHYIFPYFTIILLIKISLFMQSAYNGRGDRSDPSTWPEVEGPLTVS